MSGIISKLRNMNNIENVTFANLTAVEAKIEIGKIKFTEVLNSRVDDFVSLVVMNSKLYVLGFMGTTCIAREVPVSVQYKSSELPFTFSVSRDILKVMDNREELTVVLDKGIINWSFKFGEGYVVKSMKSVNSMYDVKKYLDFIFNSEVGNEEGSVNTKDLNVMRKVLSTVTTDPRERNIILGKGSISAILPTFAIYLRTSVDTDMLLSENILSNLPRNNVEFTAKTYKGLSGLLSKGTNPYYIIFRSLVNDSFIEEYMDLPIKWIGSVDNKIKDALGVLSFGEDREMELNFNKETQTVIIKDLDDDRNQYIGRSKVLEEGNVRLNSMVKGFPELKNIGRVDKKGYEYMKAISLQEGHICLIR